jgi:histidine ammonia-lyase
VCRIVTPVTIEIGRHLSFDDVVAVARRGDTVALTAEARERIAAARRIVEDAAASPKATYGINTGIGDLATVRIDPSEAATLQHDLVRAHATAVGPTLAREVVRAMLLLKARTFAFGHSGVRLEIVERLVEFLNRGIHPVVPSQGSLGASGDLAPLAHLALPLFGEGLVEYRDEVGDSANTLQREGLPAVGLSHKEGLSLVNGTEGMLACAILAYDGAVTLARTADVTGAMSVEALLGTDAVFQERVVGLRRHPGALTVARNLRTLLGASPIVASHRDSEHLVQDAYSLRCIPQVHGAYRDGVEYVRGTLEAELGSAIDNPSVLPEEGAVLSSGNFHGEALGLALDHLGLCLTGFATIAERRVARLVDPHLSNGLPAFLTADPGRRTGFMIAHYTAAALVSENRSLCWPASSDSIPTSAGQEDHVSMGATSARRALAILANSEHAAAIEALAASQGVDLRGMEPAPATKAVRAVIRETSPELVEDRSLSGDIEAVRKLIADGVLVAAAEGEVGTIT